MIDKAALRTEMRRRRLEAVASAPLLAPAEYLARLAPGQTVAPYVATRGEADPALLARAAAERGCRLALPHVTDRTTPLRFLAWDGSAALQPGPFGLSQPHHEAEEVAPDLILTPLVAFDAALNRLGQGAGYYDRAFAAFPQALRIGVAFSFQGVRALPLDPWDVPLHAIVTEQGWITA